MFTFVGMFLTLIHKLFIFYGAYFFLPWYLRFQNFRNAVLAAAPIFSASFGVDLLFLLTGGPLNDPSICERLLRHGADPAVCEGVMSWHSNTIKDTFFLDFIPAVEWPIPMGLLLSAAIAFVPPLLMLFVKNQEFRTGLLFLPGSFLVVPSALHYGPGLGEMDPYSFCSDDPFPAGR